MAEVWDEIRRDFPALAERVHLNAAACSPTPRPVRESVEAFLRDLEQGSDYNWTAWIERQEQARATVARFIGAEVDEIAFVPNTSAGINLIADLIGAEGPVLSDELEFPTVTLPWIHRGILVNFVPAVEGVIRLESFGEVHAPRAATIAISHVQFSNGCRQDLGAFGALKGARRLVVSASQGLGAFPVDVKASKIDALACAGQKWLCAGFGAGLLYVSRELLAKFPPRAIGWMSVVRPFAFDNARYSLLPAARRMEMGCPNLAPIFALGAALDYLTGIGISAIAERVLSLNMYLTMRLERAGFRVLSPGADHRSGETLVEVDDPRRVAHLLRERGVLVTRKAEGVRISTHFYNNEADVDTCVAGLEACRTASP
jgi:selenocysteine lyase/cysteine desulfurase